MEHEARVLRERGRHNAGERKSDDGSSQERESQQEPEEQISSGDRRNIEEGQMRQNALS